MRAVLAAAVVGAAAAAGGTQQAQVTWFADANCGAGYRTIVLLDQQTCQAVPQVRDRNPTTGPQSAGYSVTCHAAPDGTVTATLSFHDSATCGDAGNFRVVPAGACVQNAPGWGAAALRVDCNPVGPPPAQPLLPGDFSAVYYDFEGCDDGGHETYVVGPANLCHAVPQRANPNGARVLNNNVDNYIVRSDTCGFGSPGGNNNGGNQGGGNQPPQPSVIPIQNLHLAGYRVECFADGTGGIFIASSTGTCSDQLTATPFRNGQCLSNPAAFGSRSVIFRCARAQTIPPTHAIIRYFEQPQCVFTPGNANSHRTIVIAKQGVCQRVPDRDAGYRLTCLRNEDGTQSTTGVLQFCNADCSNCAFSTTANSNQCVANSYNQYGSASYSISCLPEDISHVAPVRGDAIVHWSRAPGCADETANFTTVIAPSGICHVVPPAQGVAAPSGTTGYLITCADDGRSGVFQTCSRGCTSCTTSTVFFNDPAMPLGLSQCIPNPASTGSSSVRFSCMTPFPTNVPVTGLPGDFNTGEGNPGSLDHTSGAAAISVTGVVVAAAVAAGAAAVGLP